MVESIKTTKRITTMSDVIPPVRHRPPRACCCEPYDSFFFMLTVEAVIPPTLHHSLQIASVCNITTVAMVTIPRFFQFDDDVTCHSLRSCDGVGHDLSQSSDNVSLVQPRSLKFGDTNFMSGMVMIMMMIVHSAFSCVIYLFIFHFW